MQKTVPEVLVVNLLGTPTITYSGEDYAVLRRQVRGLLYCLAAEAKPLSRESLCDLFWRDLPGAAARRHLSRLLAYLSKALPSPNLLLADHVQVQLDLHSVQVDCRSFAAFWDQWLTHGSIAPVDQAVKLYRGPFLEGFYLADNRAYDAWIQENAAYWQERVLAALSLLVEETTRREHYFAAVEFARKMLAINELSETVHRRLIELHALRGDWGAALGQYEDCAAILERELGLKPAPETQAAYQAVLDRQLPGELLAAEPQVWTVLPGLQTDLIGRQEPLDALGAHFERARLGSGSLVLIDGEPGIGKSRLMQEFCRQPRLHTRVLVGSALRECCTIPYQPLVQALRPLLDTGSVIDHIPLLWLAEAARLFPELTKIKDLPQLPEVLIPEIAIARIFDALFRLLIAATEAGYTLVLCLDDLQWADTLTLDWLVYAASRIGNLRLLLLGSCRRNELESLSDWLASFRRLEHFHQIHLTGLESKAVLQLASRLPKKLSLDVTQAQELCRVTGGNPFFLLEILRGILERGQDLHPGLEVSSLPVPETVQQAVAARLQYLRPRVRQTLEAAAVLGISFAIEPLCLTSGRGELEILDSLDELVARQFLVERPAGYEFIHLILRDAVCASLSYWRRIKLNQRAGLALEKTGSEDWPRLAWYFQQAERWQTAARYAERAGHAARRVYAHKQARAYFEQALEMLRRDAAALQDTGELQDNWHRQIELLYDRAWALRLLGDMAAFTADLQQVAKLAHRLDDQQALAHLRWQEAIHHRWYCRYPQAWASAEDGLRRSRQCRSAHLQAHCQRELGLLARETGDDASARVYLEAALEIFQSLDGFSGYSLHTLGNLSTLHLRRGELDLAGHYAHLALELCSLAALNYERRVPLGDLGAVAIAAGDYAAARQYLRQSLAMGRKTGDISQEIFCLGHLGWLHLHTGENGSARQHLLAALDQAERIGSLTEQSWLQLGLAHWAAARADPTSAAAHAERAVRIARSLGRVPDLNAAVAFLQALNPPE